mmetsp:Transcript_38926/g.49694  ORF Transcript_38926/g.49694 Transcript_38926/m.49694 type:complete len:413 (+) Transcript_38926:75-1313(+)
MGARYSMYTFALHRAASQEDISEIKRILEMGVDINQCDTFKQTPLHVASSKGRTDNVEFLLENGSYIHSKDSNGSTALHLATDFGYPDTVEVLLSKGAFVKTKDDNNYTPLHWACIHGHIDIVLLLLEHGADIGATDCWLWTPLHWACYHGHIDLIDVLFENGAKFDAEDHEGNVPGVKFSKWIDEKKQMAVQDKIHDLLQRVEMDALKISLCRENSWFEKRPSITGSPYVAKQDKKLRNQLSVEQENRKYLEVQLKSLKKELCAARKDRLQVESDLELVRKKSKDVSLTNSDTENNEDEESFFGSRMKLSLESKFVDEIYSPASPASNISQSVLKHSKPQHKSSKQRGGLRQRVSSRKSSESATPETTSSASESPNPSRIIQDFLSSNDSSSEISDQDSSQCQRDEITPSS